MIQLYELNCDFTDILYHVWYIVVASILRLHTAVFSTDQILRSEPAVWQVVLLLGCMLTDITNRINYKHTLLLFYIPIFYTTYYQHHLYIKSTYTYNYIQQLQCNYWYFNNIFSIFRWSSQTNNKSIARIDSFNRSLQPLYNYYKTMRWLVVWFML